MASTILKPEFVDKLHKRLPKHYKQDIALAVDIILDSITTALQQGKRVEIRGIGSFMTTTQSGRTFQNPKTNMETRYSTRKRIHFQPSRLLLKQKITQLKSTKNKKQNEDQT